MKEIIHEILTSTAGQIGVAISAILSGKWFFDFMRNKIQLQHDTIDLDSLKVKNLKEQIIEMQQIIDKLQNRVNEITNENISLKKQIYELTDKHMQIELKLNRIMAENKKKDKELAECLEKLKKR